MKKNGYGTEPHNITNIYPSGHESSKRETQKKTEETENTTE